MGTIKIPRRFKREIEDTLLKLKLGMIVTLYSTYRIAIPLEPIGGMLKDRSTVGFPEVENIEYKCIDGGWVQVTNVDYV